jgi:HD-like signal output (HDOD) protein/DNA-binding response OmpR family regulator
MSTNPHRVLVVDRAELAQQQAAEVLQREGFVCEIVGDGRRAMEMLAAEPFDVVVSDLKIPDGNGRSFCLELLQTDDCPPTIIVTDAVQPHIVQALMSRGAADVCIKPVDYAALATTIKGLVNRSDKTNATSTNSDTDPQTEANEENQATGESSSAAQAAAAGFGADPSQAQRIVTILVQDQDRRDDLARRLAAIDVKAIVATGSEDLLQQLNQQRIDLVIIENDLGGFLTGLEILKRLADNLIRPNAMLLAKRTERIDKQAEELGIKTIIDPQADLDDVVQAINGLSSDVSSRSELIPEKARKLVQDFAGIPPLPQLVLKLTGYMAMKNEDIPIKELANDISFDPKAISELLKLTNSASMGLRRKVTKVQDAVTLLGPKRVISLIVASATITAQSQLLKKWSQELRKWYYKRSVLMASTASIFAEKMEHVSADSAFILGLMQDLGMLVFANSFGDKYTLLIERFREVGQLRMHQLEEKEFKLSHPAVSAALLQKWKFPQSLIGPILDHHDHGSTSERSKLEHSLLHSMRIGEALADMADLAHPIRRQALNQLLAKYDDELGTDSKTCLAESVAKAAESCKLFSLPIPDADEMKQLVESITLTD